MFDSLRQNERVKRIIPLALAIICGVTAGVVLPAIVLQSLTGLTLMVASVSFFLTFLDGGE